MKHWLTIWSSETNLEVDKHPECIRSGVGETAKEACMDCWGVVAPNMSAIQLTLYELRTNKHRRKYIDELVRLHNNKMRQREEKVNG